MASGTLAIGGLSVSYGKAVQALREVSLVVPEGAVTAVLGANGAGKSTLLRAISGTLSFHRGAIEAGEITLGGRRLDGLHPAAVVAAGVVQVPEGRRIFGRLTVEENLRAGALGARDRSGTAAARKRVLELFPVLAERAKQRAGLLSGGEQQMLAMGRALMARPKVLLLDEPTLGLAPLMAERIGETIAEINRQGTSVLLIEQNAALALRLAHTAYVLEVGRVTLSGPADELAASDEVRRRYLGVGGEEELQPEFRRPPTLERWAG
ncbi:MULTISPECIES: ABC transporter ATP-binding protein [Thermomonospora]|uniref:ABC transporter related protein n=1 Tax=Thermomonospora curvata (strain ATCC 19995 / DSM 43183 / JCM 3096 / KCTC 9072 / NBRC 15933 / NCIMB 10081 / Henssen B9) TaxID=471852 RepID=D1A9L7_THECD|nr:MULTISPECIES: ABC transporter ATP-binding protein [Thermomonospora]ACY98703.1 ABC transporter related protein [Thermomonospora curvata DSM 43183]PKK13824.1 MAG: ABC transporter ATP-binding protein [Thermomonospora sp. CIF 1]